MTVIEKASATAAASASSLTMVLSFLNNNAAGIGAVCSILTVLIYFASVLWRIKHQSNGG